MYNFTEVKLHTGRYFLLMNQLIRHLSVNDSKLGFLVEDVNLAVDQSNLYVIASLGLGSRSNTGGDAGAKSVEVQECLVTHQFGNFNVCLDATVNISLDIFRLVMYVFRTDAENNFLADVVLKLTLAVLGDRELDGVVAKQSVNMVASLLEFDVDEVHLRRSDEAGNEHVAGLVIQELRSIDLLNDTVLHNDDLIAQRHSLCLVMCNIDECGTQSQMELGNLGTHLSTELSVEVGKRLVEKEDLRLTNDSTTHSNTLTLTAGESLRLSVEQVADVEQLLQHGG